MYSSNPNVAIAHSRSSPLIVFLFSFWHLSLALHHHRPTRSKASHRNKRRDKTRPISLAGDEADELGDALLHRLLSVLSDLGVGGERLLHDPDDVGDREEPILLPYASPRSRAMLAALVTPASASGARRWSLRHLQLGRNPRSIPRRRSRKETPRRGEVGGRGGGGEERRCAIITFIWFVVGAWIFFFFAFIFSFS